MVNTNMTVPISIGTAIAIQEICGFDAEGSPTGKGSIVHEYQNLFVNVRTLARNFIGGQQSDLRNQLNEKDILYGIISDLRIMNEVLQKYTSVGIKINPYVCLYKDIAKVFPKATLKHPRTEIQRKQKTLEDNVIDLLLMTQTLNKRNDILIFNTKFNIDKVGDTLILTHHPIDLLNDNRFSKLVLLESHTGKRKTGTEWNTKLKNFKPEFNRIPFNDLTVQLFGDTGDVLFPMLSPKLKNELASIADKFQWNPLTTKQRMVNGVMLSGNKDLHETVKELSYTGF